LCYVHGEFFGEIIVKIGSRLPKLSSNIKCLTFLKHSVYSIPMFIQRVRDSRRPDRRISYKNVALLNNCAMQSAMIQELISTVDSRTLRPVNVLGLLIFSNNIKNGINDIIDIKRLIMACP